MKNSKFIKNLFVVVLLIASAFAFQACTPDEIDDFADGYRQGYYGNY